MGTPLNVTPHWAIQYLGRPWVAGGRGPDAFDCWGFFRYVQQLHYGRELPDIDVERMTRRDVYYLAGEEWRQVEFPRDGDAVLMPRLNEIHIGLWLDVDGGKVLHCANGFGVVIQSLKSISLDGWPRADFWGVR